MEERPEFLSGDDRFMSLHLNAKQRAFKVEGLRALEEAYEQEHLFKPQITKKGAQMDRRGRGRDRFEDLYRDAETRKLHQAALEREVQRAECTFQPSLQARSRSVSPTRRSPERNNNGSGGFSSRLHPSEQFLKEKKARAEALKFQYETEGCTFKPKLHRGHQMHHDDDHGGGNGDWSKLPVHERLSRYHAAREMRLQMLRANRDEAEGAGLDFQPRLATHNSAAARRARSASPAPRHRGGSSSGNSSVDGSPNMSVFERLARDGEHHMERRKNAVTKDRECTFQPNIYTRRQTRSTSPAPRPESKMSVTRRLQEYDNLHKARLERLAARIEEERQAQCTFKPNISPLARSKSASADDFRGGTGAGCALRRHPQAKTTEEYELERCTFKPQIPRAPGHVGGSPQREGSIIHRLYLEAQLAKEKLERKRREQEQKDRTKYTFKPQIPRYQPPVVVAPSSPVIVPPASPTVVVVQSPPAPASPPRTIHHHHHPPAQPPPPPPQQQLVARPNKCCHHTTHHHHHHCPHRDMSAPQRRSPVRPTRAPFRVGSGGGIDVYHHLPQHNHQHQHQHSRNGHHYSPDMEEADMTGAILRNIRHSVEGRRDRSCSPPPPHHHHHHRPSPPQETAGGSSPLLVTKVKLSLERPSVNVRRERDCCEQAHAAAAEQQQLNHERVRQAHAHEHYLQPVELLHEYEDGQRWSSRAAAAKKEKEKEKAEEEKKAKKHHKKKKKHALPPPPGPPPPAAPPTSHLQEDDDDDEEEEEEMPPPAPFHSLRQMVRTIAEVPLPMDEEWSTGTPESEQQQPTETGPGTRGVVGIVGRSSAPPTSSLSASASATAAMGGTGRMAAGRRKAQPLRSLGQQQQEEEEAAEEAWEEQQRLASESGAGGIPSGRTGMMGNNKPHANGNVGVGWRAAQLPPEDMYYEGGDGTGYQGGQPYFGDDDDEQEHEQPPPPPPVRKQPQQREMDMQTFTQKTQISAMTDTAAKSQPSPTAMSWKDPSSGARTASGGGGGGGDGATMSSAAGLGLPDTGMISSTTTSSMDETRKASAADDDDNLSLPNTTLASSLPNTTMATGEFMRTDAVDSMTLPPTPSTFGGSSTSGLGDTTASAAAEKQQREREQQQQKELQELRQQQAQLQAQLAYQQRRLEEEEELGRLRYQNQQLQQQSAGQFLPGDSWDGGGSSGRRAQGAGLTSSSMLSSVSMTSEFDRTGGGGGLTRSSMPSTMGSVVSLDSTAAFQRRQLERHEQHLQRQEEERYQQYLQQQQQQLQQSQLQQSQFAYTGAQMSLPNTTMVSSTSIGGTGLTNLTLPPTPSTFGGDTTSAAKTAQLPPPQPQVSPSSSIDKSGSSSGSSTSPTKTKTKKGGKTTRRGSITDSFKRLFGRGSAQEQREAMGEGLPEETTSSSSASSTVSSTLTSSMVTAANTATAPNTLGSAAGSQLPNTGASFTESGQSWATASAGGGGGGATGAPFTPGKSVSFSLRHVEIAPPSETYPNLPTQEGRTGGVGGGGRTGDTFSSAMGAPLGASGGAGGVTGAGGGNNNNMDTYHRAMGYPLGASVFQQGMTWDPKTNSYIYDLLPTHGAGGRHGLPMPSQTMMNLFDTVLVEEAVANAARQRGGAGGSNNKPPTSNNNYGGAIMESGSSPSQQQQQQQLQQQHQQQQGGQMLRQPNKTQGGKHYTETSLLATNLVPMDQRPIPSASLMALFDTQAPPQMQQHKEQEVPAISATVMALFETQQQQLQALQKQQQQFQQHQQQHKQPQQLLTPMQLVQEQIRQLQQQLEQQQQLERLQQQQQQQVPQPQGHKTQGGKHFTESSLLGTGAMPLDKRPIPTDSMMRLFDTQQQPPQQQQQTTMSTSLSPSMASYAGPSATTTTGLPSNFLATTAPAPASVSVSSSFLATTVAPPPPVTHLPANFLATTAPVPPPPPTEQQQQQQQPPQPQLQPGLSASVMALFQTQPLPSQQQPQQQQQQQQQAKPPTTTTTLRRTGAASGHTTVMTPVSEGDNEDDQQSQQSEVEFPPAHLHHHNHHHGNGHGRQGSDASSLGGRFPTPCESMISSGYHHQQQQYLQDQQYQQYQQQQEDGEQDEGYVGEEVRLPSGTGFTLAQSLGGAPDTVSLPYTGVIGGGGGGGGEGGRGGSITTNSLAHVSGPLNIGTGMMALLDSQREAGQIQEWEIRMAQKDALPTMSVPAHITSNSLPHMSMTAMKHVDPEAIKLFETRPPEPDATPLPTMSVPAHITSNSLPHMSMTAMKHVDPEALKLFETRRPEPDTTPLPNTRAGSSPRLPPSPRSVPSAAVTSSTLPGEAGGHVDPQVLRLFETTQQQQRATMTAAMPPPPSPRTAAAPPPPSSSVPTGTVLSLFDTKRAPMTAAAMPPPSPRTAAPPPPSPRTTAAPPPPSGVPTNTVLSLFETQQQATMPPPPSPRTGAPPPSSSIPTRTVRFETQQAATTAAMPPPPSPRTVAPPPPPSNIPSNTVLSLFDTKRATTTAAAMPPPSPRTAAPLPPSSPRTTAVPPPPPSNIPSNTVLSLFDTKRATMTAATPPPSSPRTTAAPPPPYSSVPSNTVLGLFDTQQQAPPPSSPRPAPPTATAAISMSTLSEEGEGEGEGGVDPDVLRLFQTQRATMRNTADSVSSPITITGNLAPFSQTGASGVSSSVASSYSNNDTVATSDSSSMAADADPSTTTSSGGSWPSPSPQLRDRLERFQRTASYKEENEN